ncbi:MAG: F420-dependent oxidoreductase-like protein [Verrucomicrobiales bacterium]|jgi:F420-dependent oxidoreductase-like protein
MKISMTITYSDDPLKAIAHAQAMERSGVDQAWVAEAYSFDAVSTLGFLAASTETMELVSGILPIYSRTPTLIAMTAATLDSLSGGRFALGLGASGPQVIEGWHGVPYDRPLGRTREIIEICRKVWKRERLEHEGRNYQMPLPADKGTGLGKPLKLINTPLREDIPIYIASIGEKNVELTAEIATGWIPVFFHPEKAHYAWGAALDAGHTKRDPALGELQIIAGGMAAITKTEEEAAAMRDFARPNAALYIGGMGAKSKNFYNTLFQRYGYEEEAEMVQDLYLSGKKEEAAAAIPDEFLAATNLVGTEGFIKDRLEAFAEAGVTSLTLHPVGEDPLAVVSQIKEWAS